MWGAAPILFHCARCSGRLLWARPAAATPGGAGPAASPPPPRRGPSWGGGRPLGSGGGGGPRLWLPSLGGVRGGGWVGLGEGLTWSPTHGPRCLPCRTRPGSCTRVSGHKAYRTVDRPQTPRWRSRAGDAAVPVCMCPCVFVEGGGGCGTPACSIVVRRWRTWCGEVCAWCSRPRQGGWRA